MAEVYNERIDKILSSAGLLSRRDCARACKGGRITVNGKTEKSSSRKVTQNDVLCLDGSEVIYSEFIYILMNKPQGYVCAAEDGRYPTVFTLLPAGYSNLGLFTVGRLDMNTTGVLIITNDGQLAHSLLAPKNKIFKTYSAQLKFPVSENDIKLAAEGLKLDNDETALPAIITKISDTEAHIKVYEGKFHLIKRIFLALHNQVRELERIDFTGITCKGLEIGEWRQLDKNEIDTLKSAANGKNG